MTILKSVSALSIAILLPLAALAQPPEREGMDPERRLEKMQQELDLSEAQRESLAEIFAEHRTKMEALRAETEQQVNAVLDEQQQQKLEAMLEHRKERFEKWRGNQSSGEDGERQQKWREKMRGDDNDS